MVNGGGGGGAVVGLDGDGPDGRGGVGGGGAVGGEEAEDLEAVEQEEANAYRYGKIRNAVVDYENRLALIYMLNGWFETKAGLMNRVMLL